MELRDSYNTESLKNAILHHGRLWAVDLVSTCIDLAHMGMKRLQLNLFDHLFPDSGTALAVIFILQ